MSYQRSKEDNRRLKKIHESISNKYSPSGVFVDKRTGRYKKYYSSDTKWSKYLKLYCRRYVRRKLKNSSVLYQRGKDKKVIDYKWMLY